VEFFPKLFPNAADGFAMNTDGLDESCRLAGRPVRPNVDPPRSPQAEQRNPLHTPGNGVSYSFREITLIMNHVLRPIWANYDRSI
jgi:hypothetical protein